MAQIAVLGTGYVGLVYCAALADLGNRVRGVDINAERVARLSDGECPIFEPGLPELLERNRKAGRLTFTTDYAAAIPGAEFVFICVDTPSSESGDADMRAVRKAAAMLGPYLADDAVVVNKSTMPIGSGDMVEAIIAEHLPDGRRVSVVSNPEFLREGAAVQDVLRPDRIVLGADDPAVAERVASLYRVLNAPIVITDRRSSEMIKYASNAFLATKISFVNEIAKVCERVGADVTVVAKGMGLDARIGERFLEAGVGFGGSCFPKDVKALVAMAHDAGSHPQLLHAVLEINADQRRRAVQKLRYAFGDLNRRRVAVWGLAFKQDTDDLREAPALDIIRALESLGARVVAYDPAAMEHARALLPQTEFAAGAYEAVTGADALVVVTPWNEFKQADLARVRELMQPDRAVLLDGRNLYDPARVAALGFTHIGIGRQTREPQSAVAAD
jgi:UDPglucose 6-dehydrogenase